MEQLTAMLLRGLVALALSAAVGPVVLAFLRRAAILDHPSERSSHARPVPRGGGVGPAAGALAALLATPALGGSRWPLVVTVGVFGALGLVEDVVGIAALRRLGMQLALGALGAALLLDDLTGPVPWRVMFALATAVWLVGFVNAFNFMDGIDGISIAQAVGAGLVWLLAGRLGDVPVLAYGGVIVAGAALGFAPFNLFRARMFLGDVGSYFLGAMLAVLAILGLRAGLPPEAVLAPLALYVADTGTTLVRRVARHERWYEPHRGHAYQRLTDVGWSHMATAALVAASVLACGALGLASLGDSLTARVAADVAIAGVVVGYLAAPRWLARRGQAVALA